MSQPETWEQTKERLDAATAYIMDSGIAKDAQIYTHNVIRWMMNFAELREREARAQAYEEIAEHINKPFACPLCKEELEAFYKHHCSPGNETLSPMQSLRIWLRSESKRIRESK